MINPELTDRLLGPALDRLLGLGPARSERLTVTRDIAVPLPDGTSLASDHYRPANLTQGPVVLVRTPYDKSALLGRAYGLTLARRGLQVFVQDVRGTFGSPGEFEPFRHERADGLATLDWLREQPWCDGRVAMAGASYVGYTQWAVAPYAEPRLSAVALGITAADFRPTFYPGGSLGWQVAVSWSALIGSQEDRQPFWTRAGFKSRVSAAMATLPAEQADRAAIGKRVPFLHDVLEHAEPDDEHWKFLGHSERPDQLGTPASMVAGWYDIFLTRQLEDFRALQQAGIPARLTVGPWWHGQQASFRTMFGDQADWLTGHLLDDPLILRRSPVRIYLQQADRWLDFDRWPVPARPRDFHLDATGALLAEPATDGPASEEPLAEEPPTDEAAPSETAPSEVVRAFRYDPADPTPTVGGVTLGIPGGQRDNRRIEARDDVLCYQSEPLEQDLDVIGESQAVIYLRTEHPDADIFVRVCDVEPSGRSLNVIEGIRRLRPTDQAQDDLGTRRVEIPLLPTAYRFLRGRRIRVQVSGGAFPNYIRNHQTGEPMAGAVGTVPGRTQILHGPEHPSRITLAIFDPEADGLSQ